MESQIFTGSLDHLDCQKNFQKVNLIYFATFNFKRWCKFSLGFFNIFSFLGYLSVCSYFFSLQFPQFFDFCTICPNLRLIPVSFCTNPLCKSAWYILQCAVPLTPLHVIFVPICVCTWLSLDVTVLIQLEGDVRWCYRLHAAGRKAGAGRRLTPRLRLSCCCLVVPSASTVGRGRARGGARPLNLWRSKSSLLFGAICEE